MSKSHEEHVQEMKNIMEREGGKEVTWDEAEEAFANLGRYANLIYEFALEDRRRKNKLREFPKGYILESRGYSCAICGNSTQENENWYDQYGIKCSICQKAINRKEILPSIAKNRDNRYSEYDMESDFNVNKKKLKEWIEAGIIKPRTVMDGSRVHCHIFLIKDNKDFLPQRKMVKSYMVKEDRNGETWYHSEPWYRFVDPFEHLKGYRIMEHMRVVSPEEMAEREAEEKKRLENRYARREAKKRVKMKRKKKS
ncbi:MAG: hypothetical protein V4469_02305 [Patescibacteria group bacterium]